MRLTKIQKNFREEMKQIQNHSPYDNSRSGNPFHEKGISTVSGFVLVVVIALALNKYWVKTPNRNNEHRSFSPRVVNGGVNTTGKFVPASEARFLREIWNSREEVGANWAKISEQHQVRFESRNISQYRTDLINQITTCDKWLLKFRETDSDSPFMPVVDLVKEYTLKSRMACKYYLDYVNSGNKSDLDIANNYLESGNKISKMIQPKFIEILRQQDYGFEFDSDGRLQYSVEEE